MELQYRSATSRISGISRIFDKIYEQQPPPLQRSLEPTGLGLSGTCLDHFRGPFLFEDQSLIFGFIPSGPGTDFHLPWFFFNSLGFWVNTMANEVDVYGPSA